MSKERKFHELIEQQNREEKDAVWAKIQQKEMERQKEEAVSVSPKPHSFSWRKWAPIMASSLVAVVIGGVATWGFLSLNNKTNDDNKGRYFTSQSYEKINTQSTLKDYALEIGKNLLYFDWYEETDYLKNQVWQLNDTSEIICFQENIIDINTGCKIVIFVIEVGTQIEDFSLFEESDKKSELEGVQIDWQYSQIRANAKFVYENYTYYLRIDEPIDENYILDLVEELLP